MIHRRIRVDWQAISAMMFIFLAILGWGVSVEVRLSQGTSMQNMDDRLRNIERNMLPLMVDLKMRQLMEEKGIKTQPKIPDSIVLPPSPPPSNKILEEQAKKWAEGQFIQKK